MGVTLLKGNVISFNIYRKIPAIRFLLSLMNKSSIKIYSFRNFWNIKYCCISQHFTGCFFYYTNELLAVLWYMSVIFTVIFIWSHRCLIRIPQTDPLIRNSELLTLKFTHQNDNKWSVDCLQHGRGSVKVILQITTFSKQIKFCIQ